MVVNVQYRAQVLESYTKLPYINFNIIDFQVIEMIYRAGNSKCKFNVSCLILGVLTRAEIDFKVI